MSVMCRALLGALVLLLATMFLRGLRLAERAELSSAKAGDGGGKRTPRGGGTPLGIHKLDVSMTHEDADVAAYDAVVVGPAHAHDMVWADQPPGEGADHSRSRVECGGVPSELPPSSRGVPRRQVGGHAPVLPRRCHRERTRPTSSPSYPRSRTRKDACVWIDETEELPTIATATYACIGRFAQEFAEFFYSLRMEKHLEPGMQAGSAWVR